MCERMDSRASRLCEEGARILHTVASPALSVQATTPQARTRTERCRHASICAWARASLQLAPTPWLRIFRAIPRALPSKRHRPAQCTNICIFTDSCLPFSLIELLRKSSAMFGIPVQRPARHESSGSAPRSHTHTRMPWLPAVWSAPVLLGVQRKIPSQSSAPKSHRDLIRESLWAYARLHHMGRSSLKGRGSGRVPQSMS